MTGVTVPARLHSLTGAKAPARSGKAARMVARRGRRSVLTQAKVLIGRPKPPLILGAIDACTFLDVEKVYSCSEHRLECLDLAAHAGTA